MVRFKLMVILLLACTLGGCAGLDSFLGLDPTTGEISPGSSAETLTDLTGLIYPAATGAVTFLITLLVDIRRKRWKRATFSGVSAITAIVKQYSKDGEIKVSDLLRILHSKQVQVDGVHETIKKVRS